MRRAALAVGRSRPQPAGWAAAKTAAKPKGAATRSGVSPSVTRCGGWGWFDLFDLFGSPDRLGQEGVQHRKVGRGHGDEQVRGTGGGGDEADSGVRAQGSVGLGASLQGVAFGRV
jgi:hypothetical protein